MHFKNAIYKYIFKMQLNMQFKMQIKIAFVKCTTVSRFLSTKCGNGRITKRWGTVRFGHKFGTLLYF